MAAINGAIHRLINFPLTPLAAKIGIQQIEIIPKINGLNTNIEQLIRRKRSRQLLSEHSPNATPAPEENG